MRYRKLLIGLGAAALAAAYYQRSYRYRDPVRLPPDKTGLVAPADGTVAFVRRAEGPGQGWQLGVALSPLSVRYIYAPQDGTVQVLTRQPVRLPEQSRPADALTLALSASLGNGADVTLAAPAGTRLVARTYFSAGEPVRRGNKLAFLERGALVVLTFGEEFRPAVRVGERVTGAQTVLARPAAEV
ncbi:phosphatidylserine decarboxylase [Deinococcus sp. Marseille-Q6407]|uniref:phosphatidylserine decarboxylase n=1 Tax=Deinococcus sp. Marseille-Q6407 TaxID=2969223 RepID=UPI0021BF787F|nr:phosphatidylserine decarboxylase [Deinococcus sp. Marseille-Q6407]